MTRPPRPTLLAAPAAAAALAADARAQPATDVGRLVRVRCQGVYSEARITAVSGGRYRVEGCPSEEWVTADRLKTTDFGTFRPAGTPEPVAVTADRRDRRGSARDVGRAVRVRVEGVYHLARVTGVDGDRYRVRFDGAPAGRPDAWVESWQLAGADYGRFLPAGGAVPPPPAGTYACFAFVSPSGRLAQGQLVRSGAGFTLGAGDSYGSAGTRGRYTFAPATGRLEFRGGVMDGRAGEYNGSRERPAIELLGSGGPLMAPGSERKTASCELAR